MCARTLLVSRTESITQGLPAIVESWRTGPVETRCYPGPEDNTYYLPPGAVDAVAETLGAAEDPALVVDGVVHPGQAVDLLDRLPSVVLHDRRSVVWAHLAPENQVADTQRELREARITHRAAEAADRSGGPTAPSGTSGETAALAERIDTLRAQRDQQRATNKTQATAGYTDVDAHLVLVGRPDAPTSEVWAELTGEMPAAGTGRPAQPVTGQATIGPHTVAVTDTPGIPGTEGVPAWLQQVLPGLEVALERAALVAGVGSGAATLVSRLDTRLSAHCVQLPEPTAAAVQAAATDHLDHRRYQLQLPYTDDAHALIATLYDTAVVRDVVYEESIVAEITVAAAATTRLTRRVDAIEEATLTPRDG